VEREVLRRGKNILNSRAPRSREENAPRARQSDRRELARGGAAQAARLYNPRLQRRSTRRRYRPAHAKRRLPRLPLPKRAATTDRSARRARWSCEPSGAQVHRARALGRGRRRDRSPPERVVRLPSSLSIATRVRARSCSVSNVTALTSHPHSPVGVSVIAIDSHEAAVEYMLLCAQRMAASAASHAHDRVGQAAQVMEDASAWLARLWKAEQHAVDFMLATRSLSSLASVTSEDGWHRLLRETDGLIDTALLYTAIDW
jgi:hypothetical protein